MRKAETIRILVDHKQLTMIREVLKQRQIYFLAGTQSIYVPSRNEKYILSHNIGGKPIVKEWPDLNGVMEFRTPGEVARIELEREFPYVKRIGWPRKSIALFDWRWPLLFYGGYKGEGSYIDLVGAYHQIYRRLWIDCGFPRGRGLLPLRDVAIRVAEWKLARNSVVGVIRSRSSAGYRGNTRYQLSIGNKFLSPHLWATVQGILNEIAFQAISFGAIYINTDGYIFPYPSKVKEFEKWLIDFGLEYRVISGTTNIVAWGIYKVGSKQTNNYTNNKVWTSGSLKSISLPYSDSPTKLTEWWSKLK